MYKIIKLRGSIFCPPIKYSKSFVAELVNELHDFTPMLIRDNSMISSIMEWQLISPDNNENLVFSNNKIDFIKNVDYDVKDTKNNEFVERCISIFKKIMEIKKYECTRMALAPTVLISNNNSVNDLKFLFDKIFNIHLFKENELSTSNISQVYRIPENLKEVNIIMNYVVNFHSENTIIIENGKNILREQYMVDFDINTFANPQYRFDIESVMDFYHKSITFFYSFYDAYLNEK